MSLDQPDDDVTRADDDDDDITRAGDDDDDITRAANKFRMEISARKRWPRTTFKANKFCCINLDLVNRKMVDETSSRMNYIHLWALFRD